MCFTPFSLEQLRDLIHDVRDQVEENAKERPMKHTIVLTATEFGRLVATCNMYAQVAYDQKGK